MNYIKDLRLYNDDENKTVNAVIEICPGTSNKNELVEPNNNYLRCVRQVVGKYPFYYGSFPQTYAGDKDPLDFILFTDKEHKLLDVVQVDVIGAIKTVDDGEQDDKIICVESDCGLLSVKKQLKKALKFLKKYKGKNANMKIDKKLAGRIEADKLVKDAHLSYMETQKVAKRVSEVKPISKNDTKGNANTQQGSVNKGTRTRLVHGNSGK